jgi:integrase
MARRRARKRGNGEGSIYRRNDGRWAAEITVGFDERGHQIRPRVYGRTQNEACEKLAELKNRISRGLSPRPERLTVAQFLWTLVDDESMSTACFLQGRRYLSDVGKCPHRTSHRPD